MKKGTITFLVIAIIVIIAVLTNPDQTRHKEVLRNAFNESLQESIAADQGDTAGESNEISNAIARMVGGALIDQLLNNAVSTENYVVFSLTKMTWQGESNIVGIGAFGNVYLTKDLDRTFDEGLKDEG